MSLQVTKVIFPDSFHRSRSFELSILITLSNLFRSFLTRSNYNCWGHFWFDLLTNILCIILYFARQTMGLFDFSKRWILDCLNTFSISSFFLRFCILDFRFIVGPCIFLRYVIIYLYICSSNPIKIAIVNCIYLGKIFAGKMVGCPKYCIYTFRQDIVSRCAGVNVYMV